MPAGLAINIDEEGYYSPISSAARSGSIEAVEWLLDKGADIHAHCMGQETPMCQACGRGHLELVKFLDSKGARLQDAGSGSPLYWAASAGSMDTVAYLLDRGSKVNIDVVKYLVEQGADVNVEYQSLGSALWTASEYGHLDTVMYLCQQGANIHYSNPVNNADVLSIARQKGHHKVVQFLQQQLNANPAGSPEGDESMNE
ncbi:ankyrin repeat domain-containing protein [Endozoicomonas sp. ALE010]|uniref:ankyrin repeat domain-containing protein n=2 Tax=unclassified Endozoicomonas TaxID=2644528 RepID=UPI003BB60470